MVQTRGLGMPFREKLPPECPPAAAADNPLGTVYRGLSSDKPANDDFKSHAARGYPKKPQGIDDCRYASCSLFTCHVKARKVFELPKKRGKLTHLAILKIGEGAGLSLVKNEHVDLWMFSAFDPLLAISHVEPL